MKFLKITICVAMFCLNLCSCSSNDIMTENKADETITINGFTITEKTSTFPEEFAKKYIYSSGIGAWWTQIKVNKDGTFSGNYRNGDWGDSGDGYDCTKYQCDFQGKFEMVGKIDEYSYLVKLSDLSVTETEGKEWIVDRVRYVTSQPYGIEDSEHFVFYTPETPIKDLDEDFLFWWPLIFKEEPPETLQCYGIYNIDVGVGFISEESHFVRYNDDL